MASSCQNVNGQCKRAQRCSKPDGHKGRCNSELELSPFWESSPVVIANKRKKENECLAEELKSTSSRLVACEDEVANTKSAYARILIEKGKLFLKSSSRR
jgi:hypothetical protein